MNEMRKLIDFLNEASVEAGPLDLGWEKDFYGHINKINQILHDNQNDPDKWFIALKGINKIMAENDIIPADLE